MGEASGDSGLGKQRECPGSRRLGCREEEGGASCGGGSEEGLKLSVRWPVAGKEERMEVDG